MGKPNPQNLKPFKKGQSGNPAGRPAIPAELKEQLKKNREDLTNEIRRQLDLSFSQLNTLSNDFSQPTLVLLVARTLHKGVNSGDVSRISFIVDNACAPVPKVLELSGPDGESLRPLADVPTADLVIAIKALNKQISEAECKSTQKQQQSSGSARPSSRRGSRTES